jgi:hypothetical protein
MLRLMVYDRTCTRLPGLSYIWRAGSQLYRALDRLDASHGVASWSEALDWLAAVRAGEPIGEIQFWGHGQWGCARVAEERLDRSALVLEHPHHQRLHAIRQRMTSQSLWWFRTCETFGGAEGHAFARDWTNFFGCRAAGHTYVIGFWQSGLHVLQPGEAPSWSVREGFDPVHPDRGTALGSSPLEPNTITCLHGSVNG